jgi:hypothetical protein
MSTYSINFFFPGKKVTMLKKDAKLEMLLQILFLIPQIKSMLLIVINNIPEQFQLMPLHLTISNVL